MNPPFLYRKCTALTHVELLLIIVVAVALGFFLSVPRISGGPVSGVMTGTLNNARQLQIATQMMTLDTAAASGNGMDWTMMKSNGKSTPVTLASYFHVLVEKNYLSETDLRKLLTTPGRNPGENALTAENIGFHFFQFDDTAPPDQPFVVTANWKDRQLTSGEPDGKKGFVVFAKGGGGGIYNRVADAGSTNVFPTGAAYCYETLK